MSAYTIIDVNLTNDLSGTLKDPVVVSIENVQTGVLRPENGGLGVSAIPYGSLIMGNDQDPVTFFTGSADSDIIVWSSASSTWVTRDLQIIKSLEISASQNSIFQIDNVSSGEDKRYNIVFLPAQEGMFLASPLSESGFFSPRRIEPSDLPNIFENISIFNSFFSGTFNGIVNFTNEISGNGSGLVNLSTNQIDDFVDNVLHLVSSTSFLYDNFYNSMDATKIPYIQDVVTSSFLGGYGIEISGNTILSTIREYNFISEDDSIIFSGSDDDLYLSLGKILTVDELTASSLQAVSFSANTINVDDLNLNTLSASAIFSDSINGTFKGDLTGSYSGTGENITNIPNSSLQNDFIVINGENVALGGSITIPGSVTDVISSGQNVIVEKSGTIAIVSCSTDPVFNSVSASTILSDQTYANFFYGDGSNIFNINLESILSASINTLFASILTASDVAIYNLEASSIESQYIAGDGFNIQNLDASKINNLPSFFSSVFSGSENIEIDTTIFSESFSSVVKLKDNILVNSITSSFSGDGSRLVNIQSPLIKQFNVVGFSNGDVVSYSNSGLLKSNNSDSILSNPIGIVVSSSATQTFVQLNGEVAVNNSITSQIFGTKVYLGNNGQGVQYSDIQNNCYLVELGTFTDTNKILLNINKKWKIK